MATTACCASFVLCVSIVILVTMETRVNAMYIDDARQGPFPQQGENNLVSGTQLSGDKSSPSLFELLMTALKHSDQEESIKRGKQFKNTKPCYWSLVSCY